MSWAPSDVMHRHGPRPAVLYVVPGMTSRRYRAWLLVMALCLATSTALAAGPKPVPPSPQSSKDALARERETLDGVVAASLVGALTEQLGDRPVKIRLKHVDVQVTSLRDRLVSGQGELQIDTAQDWIGFRFSTLYDAIFENAGYPELSIGTVGPGGRTLPNDSKLVRELDDRVVGMLGKEFGYQQVRLQLDRIDTIEAGTRYLRIDANGIADFGLDGTAPTRVEALYDREQNAWLRVSYTLDGTPPPASTAPVGNR